MYLLVRLSMELTNNLRILVEILIKSNCLHFLAANLERSNGGQGLEASCRGCWIKVRYTEPLVVELKFGPNFAREFTTPFFSFLQNTTFVVEEWIWPQWTRRWSNTIICLLVRLSMKLTNISRALLEILIKSNCLLQILSLPLALKFSPGATIAATNKIEWKKVNYSHCNCPQVHLVS
jgi:hypothetical protein